MKCCRHACVGLSCIRQFVYPGDSDAPDGEILDLNGVERGEDQARLEEILQNMRRVNGARGSSIASDEGVRAAIAAGLAFIVSEPTLPALLTAVQSRKKALADRPPYCGVRAS